MISKSWIELKQMIYHWDGSWRDVYVPGTDVEDWNKWSNLVNQKYTLRWYNPATGTTEDSIDFAVLQPYLQQGVYGGSTVNFWIAPSIQINAHFFEATRIENDIDPREFNSIEDHLELLKYLKNVNQLLHKEVILTYENDIQHPLVKVAGNVRYTW